MFQLAFATIAAAFRMAFPNEGPVIAPLDQASEAILVGGVRPGARVAAYANGFFVGVATAQGPVVQIFLERALHPGERIAAVEQYGGRMEYARSLATVEQDYTTYQYDFERTGWNSSETTLTQTNVASSSFGKLFATSVDGEVYAQPLFASAVSIPGQGTHDVVYAATENDSVYALDAATGAKLWHADYADAANGLEPVPAGDVSCGFIVPTFGITGTPVLDRATSTLYFVVTAKQTGGSGAYHHYLHAVDMTTGIDRPGSPVDIQGSVRGARFSVATFDPQWQYNRPGLLLRGGVIYIGFGSYCDLHKSTAHGWLFAYSAGRLAQLGEFNTSPEASDALASLWAGGYGIASDDDGRIFFATGNGDFNGNSGGDLWGDTVMKMSSTLGVLDYFTPYNQAFMRENDQDLGSGGPMVLPAQAGPIPDLMVEVGKTRDLYLIDREKMGGYTPGGPDDIVQVITGAVGTSHGVWGGPGYFVSPTGQPTVFYCGGADHLKAFALMTSPKTELVLDGQSSMTYGGEGGAVPNVSSNGQAAGSDVVWAVERPFGAYNPREELTAFAADDLGRQLVDTSAGPWSHNSQTFPVATVISGRVFVGGDDVVTGFGLK
jgi:outer membrane protein assembly factor BamB